MHATFKKLLFKWETPASNRLKINMSKNHANLSCDLSHSKPRTRRQWWPRSHSPRSRRGPAMATRVKMQLHRLAQAWYNWKTSLATTWKLKWGCSMIFPHCPFPESGQICYERVQCAIPSYTASCLSPLSTTPAPLRCINRNIFASRFLKCHSPDDIKIHHFYYVPF